MHGIQFIHFLYGLFRWSVTQWRHQAPSIFFGVGENIAPTLGLTRATEGKWMGCLQTAINWAWLVCHHLPISCGLLSLPEMEDVGRWREVSKRCLRQYAAKLDRAHLWPRHRPPPWPVHLTGKTKYMYMQKLLTKYRKNKRETCPGPCMLVL